MSKELDDFVRSAGSVSNRIVDLSNESVQGGINPMALLAGHLMGLLALLRTTPEQTPNEIIALRAVANVCLDRIMQSRR